MQNPYYTYTQNQLVASLSGASSGSSTTSNTASPSFTGNAVTYTSSASPSWTVSLNLYGNVAPSVTAPTLAFQDSGSEVSATFTISQPDFSGELQDAVINWGGGATSSYDNLVPGTYTFYYNYTGTYQGSFSQTYSPYVVVTNVPSPDTNDLSGLITTGSSTSYTFGFSLHATPYASILQRGQYIWLNVTGSNVVPTAASIVVNGQPSQPVPLYSQTGSTYSYRFTSPLFGIQVITAIWTIDPSGLTDTATYEYATALVPPYLGTYVSALYSNTATHSYQITLSGVPSGTGFYQQLITISNPSSYGINTAGSNVQFTAQNGTLLYAWEQSINSSALQVWVKNYYGNSIIDMQVLPSFENDFSETGYLGNATISNIKYVFPNMTVSGTAGLADTLPTGSLPGSVGFYAYSVGGDYIYMPMQDYGTNTNISFYVWSNGQKIIDWYVHNDPNGNPYPGSELNSSTQAATVNVVPFSLTPSPVDYSSVGTSVVLSLAYSTQTSALMSQITLTVNGVLEDCVVVTFCACSWDAR